MTGRRRAPGRLLAAGLVQVGALAAIGWVPGARGTPLPALPLWGVAFAAHLAAWRILAASGPRPATGDAVPPAAGRVRRRILWGVGLAGRLALLPLAPWFSDDVWRYLWDGRVASHGINPFLHPPAADALDPLATAWRSLVNHPEVATIYPPGAQVAFHALALLGSSVLLFKAAWVTADLGVAALLDRLARRRGDGSGVPLLLWLWSPLVLVEVAWSGHLEPLGILPMVAALAVLGRRAGGRAAAGPGSAAADGDPGPRGAGWAGGALLGLGVSVKFAPLLAVPALLRRRGLAAGAAAVLVPALLYLPYASAGSALFDGLGEYAARWRFNGALFPVLEPLGRWPARVVAGLAVAGVAGLSALRRWTVERALFAGLGGALLVSPTLHPWYLLWILPFAALGRRFPWVLWTGLVFLAYAGLDAYRATGAWPHPPALAAAIHLPFLLLLAGSALRRRTGSGGGAAPEALDRGEEVAGREEEGEEGAGGRPRRQDADPGRQEGQAQDEPDGGAPRP